MYDFHNSTDTLKFWTEKWAILGKNFWFSSDFDETWWSCSYPCVLQFRQVLLKSDEKQKSLINSPFFCSEFQSVSRIVKIVHSGLVCSIPECIAGALGAQSAALVLHSSSEHHEQLSSLTTLGRCDVSVLYPEENAPVPHGRARFFLKACLE